MLIRIPTAFIISSVSVWGAVPQLAFIEKGYDDSDYELRFVDLMEGENFAPSYLRINQNGTVPTLVVPLAETAGQEVDTKFRALNGSIEITEFLDASRSQSILDIKGEDSAKPAPVLSPATIEGKAASDALIKMVQAPLAEPNALLLAARSLQELDQQRKGLQGTFCKNRQAALERFRAEAKSNTSAENPRTANVTERLVQWYNDKEASLAPLRAAYIQADQEASQKFVQQSLQLWVGAANVLAELEKKILLPFVFGDQISLADLHITAWLARILFIASNLESDKDEISALKKVLTKIEGSEEASRGLGPKLIQYWNTVKTRPSFQKVYKSGLH